MGLLIIGLLSCSHTEKKEKTYNIQFPPELKTVDELIVSGKFEDAQLKIDDYLNKSENINIYMNTSSIFLPHHQFSKRIY